MPTETFKNLSPEKQKKILDVAQAEFTQYGFDLASIQRITKNAEISRGSFYQYFEDKQDIFREILDKFREKKKEFMAPVLAMREDLGFFEFLKLCVTVGFQFARSHPEAAEIFRILVSSKTLNLEKLKKTKSVDSVLFLEKPIQNSIAKGEITDKYSPEIVQAYVQIVLEGIYKVLAAKNFSDPFGKEGEEIYNSFLEMIKHGISNH